MPDTRNYYCICEDNCRFPTMTYEQILEAIAEATGATPTHVEDAFITKIKESNANAQLTFWKGTEAQFNALSPLPTVTKIVIRVDANGKIYVCTDSTELTDIETIANNAQSASTEAQASANTALYTATTAQGTADVAQTAANTAQSTANTAQSTANSAQSKANAALPKSGGTMSGAITLAADPSQPMQAATKRYVDATNTYSTNEVNTGGKWIDNKTIYKKSFSATNLSPSGGYYTIGQLTGFSEIVSIDGVLYDGSAYIGAIPAISSDGYIGVSDEGETEAIPKWTATVWYTKT